MSDDDPTGRPCPWPPCDGGVLNGSGVCVKCGMTQGGYPLRRADYPELYEVIAGRPDSSAEFKLPDMRDRTPARREGHTVTLADWLLERIADDETDAKTAAGGRPDWVWTDIAVGTYHLHAAHIRRHDPARVLAECDAKRRIVYAAQRVQETLERRRSKATDAVNGHVIAYRDVVKCLALPYADHADYKPEWRV
jgi:hypothetical protein